MRLRFTLFFIFILLFSFVRPIIGQASPNVSANNAILIEQSSGRVLYEKKAHEKQSIASITKVMTAIIAIESGKMQEMARTSKRAVYTEGSSIYLEQGEKMRMEDLVYGLMLRSGNDASVVISEHIGGSVEGFVYLMNEKARWLGMTNTHFANPHGLDADDHYSTAYDMALLMRYAMDNDQFKKITGTTSYKAKKRVYEWQNKNKLLTSYYDRCTGGKTGFTRKTGRTLLTSATKDDMDLIVVTLNAPDDWRDHIRLFEWGFDNYDMKSIAQKGKKRYKTKESIDQITGFIRNEIKFPLSENEKLTKKSYLLNNTMDYKHDIAGKSIYYLNSEPIIEVPIFSTKKKEEQKNFIADFISIYKQFMGLK